MPDTADQILLLPVPRRIERRSGRCTLPADTRATVDPNLRRAEGYRLSISPGWIRISGRDDAGVFYGQQTLAQLVRQFGKSLPCMEIEDWPDFPARGVLLDVSRDKVPTMASLFSLVNELAALKINQLQLYTEHTFAYSRHRTVWKDSSPMTGEEIRELDAYCRGKFIELVPNQNSFGHMERWLKHPEYSSLAEAAEGFETPWGFHWSGPFSLCPTDPRSIELLAEMYAELLPNFSSKLFNVGCDETWDVGQGRSKADVEKKGREGVYLEFLQKVHALVKGHGRSMMFWGDIILHKPELIGQLPKGVIALEWGYEANHPFDKDGKIFHDAGVPFYVCPGTSAWCSLAGRTDNALANLKSAAENGLKHGAIGYLNTDWGDHGHLQYLPVSYLGFAAGAAYSWNLQANRDADLAAALDLHVFRDSSRVMAKVAWDLGNVYQEIKKLAGNASALFRIFVPSGAFGNSIDGVTREGLDAAESAIAAAIARIDEAKMDRPDAALVISEFKNNAAMLRHACRRGRWLLDSKSENPRELADDLRRIIAEHRRLWLARNRPGGLADSARRMEEYLPEYTEGKKTPTAGPAGLF